MPMVCCMHVFVQKAVESKNNQVESLSAMMEIMLVQHMGLLFILYISSSYTLLKNQHCNYQI